MKRFKFLDFSLLSFLAAVLFSSCKEKPSFISDAAILRAHLNVSAEVANYSSPQLPNFFKNQFVAIQNNTPVNNPTTDWGATLGRVLFYDQQLSKNNTISCASCHQQSHGFADTSRFSTGFTGGTTARHTMALANAVYYINGRFFWDERAATLEEQVLQPIEDPIEMGMTMPEVIERINRTEYYPILFENAFGSREVSDDKIARALAQFVRSMVSYDSKYDEGRSMVSERTIDFPNFSQEENAGKKIFMSNTKVNCFGCHNTDVFIGDNARNNALYERNTDEGIYTHTQNDLDKGKFKTPSLKNIAVRGRFMHDGSLTSLDQVIEHYNSGIRANANLDPHLVDVATRTPVKMGLTALEKSQLKAFLETLTDYTLLSDEKFSDPFK
jgi:cytochrome c peroxidase